MHGGQRTASWTHLFLVPRLPRRLRENTSLCHDKHMFPRKFLLQLSHESHLNLLESRSERYRHKDEDTLAAASDLEFFCAGDVELTELVFEVRVDFEVEEGFPDGFLQLVGLFTVGFDDFREHVDCVSVCVGPRDTR